MIFEYSEMDDAYDGIAPKTWFAATGSEKSYNVIVWGWSRSRRVIERDGLVCFQVTVHNQESWCYTCKERLLFVTQQLSDHNVQCFWTHDPDDGSLYVTVGPPPQGISVEIYLSRLLQWPVIIESSLREGASKRRKKSKGGSQKSRHIVH